MCIRDRNETLERSYLDLLFEHFYYQDILDGVAYRDEKTFAQNSKKIIEEYYTLRESKDIMGAVNKLVLGEMENISKVIAKYKMPSILDNISDDSTDVLHELLNLYGYQCLLKDL